MSTDIFVVDTLWVGIERLEEEAQKEYPEKLRYVLRDLGCKRRSFCLRIQDTWQTPLCSSYYRFNIDMLESKSSNFSSNQKILYKVKNEEPTYYEY